MSLSTVEIRIASANPSLVELQATGSPAVVQINMGPTGPAGTAGTNGGSTSAWKYKAKTNATSGYPGNGHLLWNNATQTSATSIIVSHLTDDDTDIELFFSFFVVNQKIFIQDRDDSSKNQVWLISGTPTVTGANTATAYYTFPVTLVSSAGGAFTNNHSILFGQISVATNSVTSATTSDGTATLSTSTLTTGTLTVSTSGVFNATSYTYGAGAASAMRTALDVLPLTSVITVTGTTPAFTEPLVDDGSLINGKRAWYTSNQELSWYAGVWTLTLSDDATILYEATNTSDSDRPWLLTGWTVTSGSGQPTLTIDLQTLQPIEGASGTIAIVDDQEGRVAPSDMTGLGTNVATALGINIGSTGAMVTSNSTVTLTNKTLTSPAIDSATIGTAATFNATTYTFGSGAAAAMNQSLGTSSVDARIASLFTSPFQFAQDNFLGRWLTASGNNAFNWLGVGSASVWSDAPWAAAGFIGGTNLLTNNNAFFYYMSSASAANIANFNGVVFDHVFSPNSFITLENIFVGIRNTASATAEVGRRGLYYEAGVDTNWQLLHETSAGVKTKVDTGKLVVIGQIVRVTIKFVSATQTDMIIATSTNTTPVTVSATSGFSCTGGLGLGFWFQSTTAANRFMLQMRSTVAWPTSTL